MKVTTTPKYQSVSARYDDNGRYKEVVFHFHGKWAVTGIGVDGTGAHGHYKFEYAKSVGEPRFQKPRKLELQGIINPEIPEETRHALAKAIKVELKDQMIGLLEGTNGDIRRAVHGIW
jgi:hypothetical protein